jgi:hypothetical protein
MSSWWRRILAVEILAIASMLMLALDMDAHNRAEMLGGVNIWGYRGPVAHRKQPHEIRVAVVGGTRAFGWGEPAMALASEIRRQIMLSTDQPGGTLRPVVVVNLGRLGAGPDSYPSTIQHFSYLQPDYICLYDDLGVPGASTTDFTSGVFDLTGYAPALPLVLREKGMLWRFGDVTRGYVSASSQPGQSTSLLRRAAGWALQTVAGGAGAADRLAARLVRSGDRDAGSRDLDPIAYAGAMMTAVNVAHRHARGVVVVASPSETDEQSRNVRALGLRLDREIGSAPWLRFVDLDAEADLHGDSLRLDGWNYGGAGISLVAKDIAVAVLGLIAARL